MRAWEIITLILNGMATAAVVCIALGVLGKIRMLIQNSRQQAEEYEMKICEIHQRNEELTTENEHIKQQVAAEREQFTSDLQAMMQELKDEFAARKQEMQQLFAADLKSVRGEVVAYMLQEDEKLKEYKKQAKQSKAEAESYKAETEKYKTDARKMRQSMEAEYNEKLAMYQLEVDLSRKAVEEYEQEMARIMEYEDNAEKKNYLSRELRNLTRNNNILHQIRKVCLQVNMVNFSSLEDAMNRIQSYMQKFEETTGDGD